MKSRKDISSGEMVLNIVAASSCITSCDFASLLTLSLFIYRSIFGSSHPLSHQPNSYNRVPIPMYRSNVLMTRNLHAQHEFDLFSQRIFFPYIFRVNVVN